jgi:hypothetical protein
MLATNSRKLFKTPVDSGPRSKLRKYYNVDYSQSRL